MWRCHCGETNVNSRSRCQACNAARLTHESAPESPGQVVRPKTVQFQFFGMGDGPVPGVGSTADAGRRILTERELASHYAREQRRSILGWLAGGVAAMAVLGLLAWQIFRPTR